MHQALVLERALLDPVFVVQLPRLHLEAPAAKFVEAADPFDRVVVGPLGFGELVDPGERRLGERQPAVQLLFTLFLTILPYPEHTDQSRQG